MTFLLVIYKVLHMCNKLSPGSVLGMKNRRIRAGLSYYLVTLLSDLDLGGHNLCLKFSADSVPNHSAWRSTRR